MANLTVTEFHLSISRLHAIAPDLTAQDIENAVKSALITKLGWSETHAQIESGDLRISVS